MRRRVGRAFLWFAVVLGGLSSAFATVASFWMVLAPLFETHRSLTPVAFAGLSALAASVWAGTGVVTLVEILRETRGPHPADKARHANPEPERSSRDGPRDTLG
jgi:hypothetical protein